MNTTEIKFRAKDENNNWVYGFFVGNFDPSLAENTLADFFIYEGLRNLSKLIPVQPETVGQFIGKLKSGEDIYINDLIQHGETIRVVSYRNGNTCLDRQNLKDTILLSFSENPKKLGNIFDNPELLEKL